MNRILILFLITLSTTFVVAQSNEMDVQIQFQSFQELLKYADEHAIQIQNALIGEQIASANKKGAKSYLYPSVNASAGYNNNLTLQPTLVPEQFFNPNATEGSFRELTFGQQHVYSTGIQAQWNILNFQKIFASETAGIVTEQSEINTQKSKLSTYNLLASTYYSILLTQEAIVIYEENLKVSEAIYKSTNENFQKGIASEEALNLAKIKQLQNRNTLQQALSNRSRFYTQLQSQLNTSQQIIISDSPQNFSLTNTNFETIHPEITWQEMEVDKQKSLLKEKKALLLPNLSLNYQYNTSWATDGFTDFSNANELPQQYIGAKLNIPIFSGFSSRSKIKKSKLELQQQELQLENTKLVKQKEDDLLLLDVNQFEEELAEYTKIMVLRQKNDVHAENKYNSGITSLNERLDSYEDLLNAQNTYLQSLASYTLAKYKMYIRQLDLKSNN
ncbi:TolC family protein [Winogradskyella sp. PG-2]|uniref:TolC family protein n=1 Tax=Winogradskyella sp. PG-2 TaxID=754409 RepID=UPI0004588A62|nr:TolC family protein [Winogradskyella sp. PG-2]BAO76399.1 outer membrane efflux protein precursor [Winogradskyella sp. PG-2]